MYLGVLAWWCVLLSMPFWPLPGPLRLAWFAILLAAPPLLMVWRKRSVAKGVYSVVSWCFNAAGLVRGLLSPRRPNSEPILSQVLKESQGFTALPGRAASTLKPRLSTPSPCIPGTLPNSRKNDAN
jgi:hypothetical protein